MEDRKTTLISVVIENPLSFDINSAEVMYKISSRGERISFDDDHRPDNKYHRFKLPLDLTVTAGGKSQTFIYISAGTIPIDEDYNLRDYVDNLYKAICKHINQYVESGFDISKIPSRILYGWREIYVPVVKFIYENSVQLRDNIMYPFKVSPIDHPYLSKVLVREFDFVKQYAHLSTNFVEEIEDGSCTSFILKKNIFDGQVVYDSITYKKDGNFYVVDNECNAALKNQLAIRLMGMEVSK